MTANPQDTNDRPSYEISDFDWSHADIARQAMMSMLKQVILYESKYEDLPSPDSQAERETILIPDVEKAYHRAGTLMMNAIDHAYALNAVLETRSITLAPWTCGRVILEVCALASWLLDDEITCRERFLRCMKLRLKDIRTQQLHYKNNLDRIVVSSLKSDFEEEQRGLALEIERFKEMSLELKLPIKTKSYETNKFENLGSTVKFAELVSQYFREDAEWYQTQSGVVHGNEWAMYNFGMRQIRPGELNVVREIVPFRAIHLIEKCSGWIGKTTLRKSKVLGMNGDEIQAILETTRPIAWVYRSKMSAEC